MTERHLGPPDDREPDVEDPAAPASAPVFQRVRRGPPRYEGQMDWGLVAILVTLAAMALYLYGQFYTRHNTITGVVAIPLFVGIALPLLIRIGKREPGFDLTNLMLTSLALHFIGAYYRLQVAADSGVYFRVGGELAAEFRSFNFAPHLGRSFIGTGFTRYLSGLVQVVTMENRIATFLVFTCFAFIGVVLCYVAATIAFPEMDRYRYAKLLFLWPSLCFWPSSIGKEAWMLLGIGITAYGAARLYNHKPLGFVVLCLGLAATGLVRPHVSLLLATAVFVAFLFRSSGGDHLRLAGKLLGMVALLAATSVMASQTTEFFDLEGLGADSIEQVAETTAEQTDQGGSAFSPALVRTPIDYPWAAVTILFRPFLFEADSSQMLITSGEAMLLLALGLVSFRRFKALPTLLRARPYLLFAGTFVLSFTWAFSAIANFGILARQRTMVTPFVLLFLALPAVGALKDRNRRTPLASPLWGPRPPGHTDDAAAR